MISYSVVKVLEARDVEKTLSFLTEDAVWVAPEGTFKGKQQLRRYLSWMSQANPDLKVRDTGDCIRSTGKAGVYLALPSWN